MSIIEDNYSKMSIFSDLNILWNKDEIIVKEKIKMALECNIYQ